MRAPLLMPVEDARELSLDEQIELANLALDVFAASLPGLKGSFGGEPATQWLCGEVWDAATVPLRLTEPLSYRLTHGAELDALRGRLLTLHEEAVALARSRRSALEVHTLTGIGLKNLAWWQPNEEVFRKMVRQTLRDATGWMPPLSEHAAWSAAWKIAEPLMGELTGCAGQAWVRLAREMSVSSDAREAYLGLGLLALETNSLRRRVEIMRTLQERFPAISDLDRGIYTRVFNVAWAEAHNDPFGAPHQNLWYQDVLYRLRHKVTAKTSTIQVGPASDSAMKMTGKRDSVHPEVRAFNLAQAARRMETIKRAGPGGVLWFYMSRKHGYTAEEIARIAALQREVEPVFAQLVKRFPETAFAHDRFTSAMRLVGAADMGYGTGLSIDSGKLINPFLPRYADMTKDLRARWRLSFDFSPGRAGSGPWHFARVMSGYGLGFGEDVKVDEILMFRVGHDGRPTDMRPVLDRFSLYSGEGGTQPQVNDRWMVIPGRGGRRDAAYTPGDKIAVLDMRNPAAESRFFPLASSSGGLRSLRLAGDRVIYSFVHNLTGPVKFYEFEKKGDATFGIAEIDLVTGRETLLASNRRQPPGAPVEGEKFRVFDRLWLIGDAAFTVTDGAKRSKYVFDLAGREWRPITEADNKAVAADLTARTGVGWFIVDGAALHVQSATRNDHLRFSGGKGIGVIDIAVNFDYDGVETSHVEWTKAHAEKVRVKGSGYKSVYSSEHGLMVSMNNGFYYWLPAEKVRAVLSQAVAVKRAAVTKPAPGSAEREKSEMANSPSEPANDDGEQEYPVE